MLTREIAIKQATNFILDCLKYGINIEKAILFGSVAKNEQRDFSDIDIALISNDFTKNFIINNRMTSKINIKYPMIEVHHFNSDYFKLGDPFVNEISTTGFELKWADKGNNISH
ncbi:MAG: nucleotidyltransferase domain-containing protein [Bacteroidales bacterium]|nr:nucleotidyltransferase domain-containing protein [Bacteroidales bacterium]